jgi:hypothetical protein
MKKIAHTINMRKLNLTGIGRYLMAAFAFGFMTTGCEDVTPGLTDGKVDLVASLINIGLKGYAVDSVYTEFDFYQGANPRITAFRKGIIRYGDGAAPSIQWNTASPVVEYGGSSINYTYEGLRSEIMLNAYGFADNVTNRYGDGSLQSRLEYAYDAAGRLMHVRVERPGFVPEYVVYEYTDDEILIREGGLVYRISLSIRGENNAVSRQENPGYICDVLRLGGSTLTNTYAIIPDLYYQGIYGTPVNYLQVETLGIPNNFPTVTQVGNNRFFYR